MLLRINDRYFVKADKTAIAVPPCCFVEAVELLFMSFFVLALSIRPSSVSFTVSLSDYSTSNHQLKVRLWTDLMRALHQMVNSRVPDN